MNIYLTLAGLLAITLGAVHSAVGEVLIFKRLYGAPPSSSPHGLSSRHIAVLWSAWHLVTLLGCGFGAVLLALARPTAAADRLSVIATIMSATMMVSAIFWICGTKTKHPAWIVLVAISALIWWGGAA